jgi:hypothetical protein
MDEFLGISDRIKTIRALLGPGMTLLSSSQSQSVPAPPSSNISLRNREESTQRPSAVNDDPTIAVRKEQEWG